MRRIIYVMMMAILVTFSMAATIRAETLLLGKVINERGVSFRVASYGDMNLSQIRIDGKLSDDCVVHLSGLQSAVSGSIKDKSLRYSRNSDETITITIDLHKRLDCKHPTTGENTPCCLGQGKGCLATIQVPKQVTGRILEALGG